MTLRNVPRICAAARIWRFRLPANSVVDLDLCFSYGFFDPYGHELELTCYDYEKVKQHLVEQGVSPVRYW